MNDLLAILAALAIAGGCGVIFYRVPRSTLPRYGRYNPSTITMRPLSCTGGAFWFASLLVLVLCKHWIGKFGQAGLLGCAFVGYLLFVIGAARDHAIYGWFRWLSAALAGVLFIAILCGVIFRN
jgi:hypothetical protein